jgi:hypothetical protein
MHFKDEFIRLPEGEELSKILEVYKRLGFPGCVASMDCTHVRWLRCPRDLTNSCIGKEGYPTLAFQIAADHGRKIIHLSKAYFGAFNDINICEVRMLYFS